MKPKRRYSRDSIESDEQTRNILRYLNTSELLKNKLIMKILILVLLAFAIATAEANRGATFSEECKVTFEKFENETEISDVIKQNTFKNTGINLNDMEKTVREKIKNNYFSCIYLLMTRGFYQATQTLNDEILVPLDLGN